MSSPGTQSTVKLKASSLKTTGMDTTGQTPGTGKASKSMHHPSSGFNAEARIMNASIGKNKKTSINLS